MLLCCPIFSAAQVSSISGIINSYYPVIETVPAKACVRLNGVSGLSAGDRVMIVQMKGATINTDASSSSFGNINNLNQAGNYEINAICSINGDSVFLIFSLLNTYNTGEKVQLVRIPQYISANVTGELKAAPWNSVTGTGGVLALWVEDNLVMNAPVHADTCGYRGGAYRNSGNVCFNYLDADAYAYNASLTSPAQNGAFKGEGVATVAGSQSGGRGAAANGGGGGNNHNNSGAGGGNLVAGGDGGGNTSSIGCNEAFVGRGGKPLSSNAGTKIFFGGGGGAGHANNGTATTRGGGSGGGIVFIRAANITGNNYRISANGLAGGNSVGDGAAGGGAGGTLVLQVPVYTGPIVIEARGGQGGHSDDGGTDNRCYGGGGGGSGGTIYFGNIPSPLTTAYNVNPGPGGIESGSTGVCQPQITGQPGLEGVAQFNYSYRASTVLAGVCSQVLAVELIDFTAYLENRQTLLRWRIADPAAVSSFVVERSQPGAGWMPVTTVAANSNGDSYSAKDPLPKNGINFYRIRIIQKNNRVKYSSTQKIVVDAENGLQVYPNPARRQLYLRGIRAGTAVTELQLFDVNGKCIWIKSITVAQGNASVILPSVESGMYYLKVGVNSWKAVIIEN